MQLSDLVGEAVIGADERFQIIYWNPAAEELLGWTAAEAMGRQAIELTHLEFPGSCLSETLDTLARTGRWHGRTMGRAKCGRSVLAETTASYLPEDADPALRYVVVSRDITAQAEMEAHLEQQKQLTQVLLDQSPVGYVTYTLDGQCVGANAEAARITGGTVDELLRQNFNTLPSWKESGLLDLARRAIDTRKPQNSDSLVLRSSFGKSLSLMVRAAVVTAGSDERLMIVIGDITTLKHQQNQLRVLTSAIEQSRSSIVITNREGVIEYVNPFTSEVTGYAPEEMIGRTPNVVKSGLMPPCVYEDLWRTIRRGGIWNGELHNRKKNGELFWENVTISPVLDEHGTTTHFIAIKTDVTARKAAEQAARDAELRFERAQKMEIVGRLAGGIAHDFNNLLTAILGYAHLLLDATRAPRLRSDLQEIVRASERASGLTRQLLTFSRTQRVEPTVVDVNSAIAGIANMAARLVGDDVKLEINLSPHPAYVRIDVSQFEQVLMNLIVNARDAMPAGGGLSITASDDQPDESVRGRFPNAADGPCVAIRARDTGTGIAPEILPRIFEPFFSTKPVGKGTGLGLAVIAEVVSQAGGCIDVQSTPGQGATFTIYLPRVEAAAASDAAPAVPPRQTSAQGRETILLVEDLETVRKLQQRVLEQLGYRVLVAADGEQAVAIEKNFQGTIDLLLTDVVLPGMAGPALAQRLMLRRPSLKVLLVSGFSRTEAFEGWSPGGHFLRKPFAPATLAAKVREVLGGR